MSESFFIQVWIHRSPMYVNAYALDSDDPDSAYQQIKMQGGVPEDYGIVNFLHAQFDDYSREELIAEILDLRKNIMSFNKYL
jgi:hypothetical protein